MSQVNIKIADSASIQEAAELLRSSNLVCFPTETVYGLGANALDRQAVAKIFEAKGRPRSNPLIVHIANIEQLAALSDYQNYPLVVQRLKALESFWPGPISLLLPKSQQVSNLVTAGSELVAVRIPNNQIALELIETCGFPLAAPSANRYTEVSPTTAQHCSDGLGDRVSLILDGGACSGGIESTVVNISSETVTIMRPGLITKEQLEAQLQEPVIIFTESVSKDRTQISPGMSRKHYSPRTKLQLLSDYQAQTSDQNIGVILFSLEQMPSTTALNPKKIALLSPTGDLAEVATNLFSALRELDLAELDLILIDSCAEIGLGTAIMDRIKRAITKE